MSTLYEDQWIECTPDDLRIRGYYFPWGTKRIPYSSIRQVTIVNMGLLTGRGRIWGSSTLRTWASLDPGRPSKTKALVLDTGGHIRPFVTPDDPDAVAAVIRERSGATVTTGPSVIP
jgi:hypothetical protein